MATAKQARDFIEKIGPIIQSYAKSMSFKTCSAIIAQACCESAFGTSSLGYKYHNYFGMKCGSAWQGKSVNLQTKEEYTPGTLTTIRDNFRAYDDMEAGVAGYFGFTNNKRYANLKDAKDYKEYARLVKEDGWATSSTYTNTLISIVEKYDLTKYDTKEVDIVDKRKKVIETMQSWIGKKEADGSHKSIIDLYNSHKPLARGYKVKYTDAWCATTVSAAAIAADCTDIIPTECGCGQMVQLFQKLGEWVENDAYTPQAGDVCFYDWQDSGSGDNTGWPDHVGIVESVSVDGKSFVVIEGNYSDSVKRRTMKVNGKYIRGFGVPKYPKADPEPAKSEAPANGTVDAAQKYDAQLARAYYTTAPLHLRAGAGTSKRSILVMPQGHKVQNYGYYSMAAGTKWLYVATTVDGVQYTGFCSSQFLK